MKHAESNPLQRELARSKLAEPHPDEDVLTAFAEQNLAARERGQVMQHLAGCAECREVLSFAVAAPPARALQEKSRALPVRLSLRGWLPWAAVAAGVAVVSSAVGIHERAVRLRMQAENAAAIVAQATPPPTLPVPSERAESESTPAPATRQIQPLQTTAPQVQANALKKAAPQAAEQADAAEQETYSNLPLISAGRPGASGGAPSPMAPSSAGQTITASAMSGPVPPPPPQIAVEEEAAHGTIAAAKSRVEPKVSAAAAPAFGGLMEGTGALARTSSRAQWRINAQGQAERSLGNGPWRTVLPEEEARMRVVSVVGGRVWLGGENLHLYRSDDGGNTWHLVQLPAKGNGDHAITHIGFQSDQLGTVEADDGTQWKTIDGGLTWK